MRQSYKTFFLWAVLILLFFSFYSIFSRQRSNEPKEIDASEFYAAVDRGEVATTTVKGNTLQGTFKGGNHQEFRTVSPLDNQLLEKMRAKNVALKFEKEDSQSLWAQFLVSWMPLGVLCILFVFLMRQLQAGGGKAMSFGKSKAKLLSENHNKVTFQDVAGIDEAKEELEEIVQFLKDPKKFTKLGGRIPKGVLLMGSPGTGKTLLSRAIAGEAGVPFFSISGSDFVEMFVGVGASRVRDLFEQGKKHAPCIIFIDEIDAVGRHRGAGLGGGHDEREQTLNQLLVEMDGFESNEGVILIAATNRPDVLDPALLRPGRFDRRIMVPRPDVRGREGILKVHTKKTPLSSDVDLDAIARGTPGFSGADLENLVNEAALIAARKGKDRLDNGDFDFAKDKVMMGAERRSMIISEKDKKITAWHEAGHALVARLTPKCDPVHKVTIIPRGPALGLTQMLPKEDRLNWDKSSVLDRIAMAMGGRIAEELTFNEITSGAKSDIDHATQFARSMVCEWGMSEKLGPLAFGEEQGEVFLGREFNQRQRNFSEATAIDIDSEVRQIVTTQYARAKQLLIEHRDALDRIAAALLEWETLDGEEVEVLIRGGQLNKTRPPPALPKPEIKRPEVKEKSKILDALGGLTAPVPKTEAGKA
ncbi:MAG: ATP-dependent zinc metalloprotease FtsH [Myxococcales bacterium]|nr:ATP-dependent zinc metalloprotease FtsH [Myxococcales bacterium]